ncbi:MAG: hypothetical protein JRG86_03770 [Deltaproteobacteria bacterium]|jgi:hypothetical protein|nr:hypothetical protein [Deltaproteobacteria bacterium]MBW2498230.1 hypothetical protein [Deltaproteobacteria bacterium]
MTEPEEQGMPATQLLEALLELATRAQLEVRVLSRAASQMEHGPTSSAACRVGERVWVVLAPDDPAIHQARVLAQALGVHRGEFLDTVFVAPAVRAFVDRLKQ